MNELPNTHSYQLQGIHHHHPSLPDNSFQGKEGVVHIGSEQMNSVVSDNGNVVPGIQTEMKTNLEEEEKGHTVIHRTWPGEEWGDKVEDTNYFNHCGKVKTDLSKEDSYNQMHTTTSWSGEDSNSGEVPDCQSPREDQSNSCHGGTVEPSQPTVVSAHRETYDEPHCEEKMNEDPDDNSLGSPPSDSGTEDYEGSPSAGTDADSTSHVDQSHTTNEYLAKFEPLQNVYNHGFDYSKVKSGGFSKGMEDSPSHCSGESPLIDQTIEEVSKGIFNQFSEKMDPDNGEKAEFQPNYEHNKMNRDLFGKVYETHPSHSGIVNGEGFPGADAHSSNITGRSASDFLEKQLQKIYNYDCDYTQIKTEVLSGDYDEEMGESSSRYSGGNTLLDQTIEDVARGIFSEFSETRGPGKGEKEKNVACPQCDKKFTCNYEMENHLRTHTREKPFICSVCDKSFVNSCNLYIHMRSHRNERPFQCDQCPSAFAIFSQLANHKRIHSDERPFCCPECGKGFKQSCNLRTHMRCHTGEFPYKCPHCDKAFKRNGSLQLHIRTHTGDKPFICSICHKQFAEPLYLDRHMNVHLRDHKYTCTVCGKHFNHCSNLTRHLKIHSGDKPFKCDVCGKSFSETDKLYVHMRVHTDEKPFVCHICDKAFSQSSTLTTHMGTHTDEKLFKCAECGKGFNQSCKLNTHMRVHTGEKPYQCSVCGKEYHRSDSLRIHMRNHTGERPYACPICQKAFSVNSHLHAHIRLHQRKVDWVPKPRLEDQDQTDEPGTGPDSPQDFAEFEDSETSLSLNYD